MSHRTSWVLAGVFVLGLVFVAAAQEPSPPRAARSVHLWNPAPDGIVY